MPGSLDTEPSELRRILVPADGPVLVMAPLDVPRSWTGDETFKRATQVANALSDEGWTVIAPWEYQIFERGRRASLLERTDIEHVSRQLGIDPRQLWLVETFIDESGIAVETRLESRSGTETDDDYRVQTLIALVVRDPRLDKTLGTVSASVDQDPFVPGADVVDALPNVSIAIGEIARAFTELMADQDVTPRAAPSEIVGDGDPVPTLDGLGIDVHTNPKRVRSYAQQGQSSLDDRLRDFDPIEQLARAVVHYQFFDRNVAIDQIERFDRLPAGALIVKDPGALSAIGLRTSDVIIEGNGVVLEGRHGLERWLRMPRPGSRQLTVRRGGRPMTLEMRGALDGSRGS